MKRTVSLLLACATAACASNAQVVESPTPDPAAKPNAQIAADVAEEEHVATMAEETTTSHVSDGRWLHAQGGSEYVLTGSHDQFIAVWVDVPEGAPRAHVPTMVTLTIDTSGSMSGEKIVQARNAAKLLVNEMKDGDLVAIHAFSDHADELVSPTRLDSRSRQLVLGTIAELGADGATNMHDALELATRRARSAPESHPVRRVVMISDGRATAGQTSRHVLGSVAERSMQHGVQVTALGVGLDYDEDTLNELAVRSSGRLFHLADPQEMPSIIAGELKLLQRTMATNATIEVVPAPGVELIEISGVRSVWSQGALQVPIGTVFAGQRRELLVRFRYNGSEVEGPVPIASTRLMFTDPNDGGMPRIQEVAVRGNLTNDPQLVERHVNQEAQAIIAMNRAATFAAVAREQVSSGDFDAADVQLAKAEEQLRQNAKAAKTQRDRTRMTQAAERIARSRQQVGAAAAAPPAAKPKAARAAGLELNDTAMDAMGF